MIYFIQGRRTKLIKIGFAQNAKERLSRLQTGSPDILELIAVRVGDKYEENELHYMFKAHKSHGEWFKPCEEIFTYINEHCTANYSDIFMAEWAINNGKAGETPSQLSQEQLISIGVLEFRKALELPDA